MTAHPFDREIRDERIEAVRVANRKIGITLDVNATASAEPRPNLILKHLVKSGGTFAISLLKHLVAPQSLRVWVEGKAVSRSDRKHYFVIGFVREPVCRPLLLLDPLTSSKPIVLRHVPHTFESLV